MSFISNWKWMKSIELNRNVRSKPVDLGKSRCVISSIYCDNTISAVSDWPIFYMKNQFYLIEQQISSNTPRSNKSDNFCILKISNRKIFFAKIQRMGANLKKIELHRLDNDTELRSVETILLSSIIHLIHLSNTRHNVCSRSWQIDGGRNAMHSCILKYDVRQ